MLSWQVMGTKLQRIGSSLPVRRSDASADCFVKEHMAKGELVVSANKYTQSAGSGLVQVAVGAVPLGAVGALMAGSIASGLMLGGVSAAVLGVLTLCLESTNRVVITADTLVVQTSVLLGRFDRDRIVDARVEALSFMQWCRLDTYLLDPRYFFKKSPGLRFHYCKPNGKTSEVFVGSGDAHELLEQLS
jgi:hypothetical protein